MNTINSYKKEEIRFTKEYYREESIQLCIRKGWDESEWEKIANLFVHLQIEKDQLSALCKTLETLSIINMHEALF